MADADDLFHRDLVRFVHEANHPNGHIITQGFVFDLKTAKLAPIPGAWSKEFHFICGSSSVLRLQPGDFGDKDSRIHKLGAHNRIAENSISMGRPLNRIDWPAVVYVFGDGETLGNISSRSAERQSSLHQIIQKRAVPITGAELVNFCLSPLIQECKNRVVPAIG
jgi:hypothetical protein